jgi:alanine dehydrogenase
MISIGANEVKKVLSLRECIDLIEDLYRFDSHEINSQPLRTLTRVDEHSVILTMPASSNRIKRFAVKIVTEFSKNPERFSIPSQGGTILLFDLDNGMPLASLDAPAITAIRTGALCGLATKILSRKNSSTVALIGSGQQARTQLEGVCATRKIKEVKVYSRDFSHAKDLAIQMTPELNIPILAVQERREATGSSDIIIAATNSPVPVIDWVEDVSPGCHINSIGTLPDRRELDSDTIRNAKLFVDLKEGVLKEAGDVMQAIKDNVVEQDHIVADLSELVKHEKIGRENDQEVTLFKSVGFGLLDVYAADFVYRKMTFA